MVRSDAGFGRPPRAEATRRRGRDIAGFEFENYDAGGVRPESLQAFVDVYAGNEGDLDKNADNARNGCNAETGAKTVPAY